MKKGIVMFLILALVGSFVLAAEDFSEAEAIIDAKTSCDQLTDDQLEMLGDYYMEQMHPGPAHEQMDAMMGGEGSESLRLMHIRMGEAFYCGNGAAGYGAGYGMGMMGGGMMGGYGMMGRGSGMMDSYYGEDYGRYGWHWLWGLLFVAAAAVIVSVVFWGAYRLMVAEKKK